MPGPGLYVVGSLPETLEMSEVLEPGGKVVLWVLAPGVAYLAIGSASRIGGERPPISDSV